MFFKVDTRLPQFVPLPRFMLVSKHTMNAKMLYAILLDRTKLSQSRGFVDDEGNVYVIFPIKQMAEKIQRSERTVKTALNELEEAGLIIRVRQGWNRANLIFVKMPEDVHLVATPEDANICTMKVQLSASPEGNISPMDVQNSADSNVQNLPPSNTNKNYTDIVQNQKGEMCLRLGQFQNVFLTEKQFAELQADYPEQYADYINHLSTYMEGHGKHYANHDAVIRDWLDKDSRSKPSKNYDFEYFDKGDCL